MSLVNYKAQNHPRERGVMSEQSAEKDAGCICPPDYCLDGSADPAACPVCTRLDPYDPCPAEGCLHDWTLRPESDTWVCEMCGAER